MEDFIYDALNKNDWWWTVGRRSLVSSLAKRHLKKKRPLKIVDVGCGTGSNLRALRSYGSVYGIDRSPLALNYCLSRDIDDVCLGDVTNLPYNDSQFDLAISVDTLEHIEDDDAALKELYRVCKPNAMVIIVVPAFQFLWSRRDDSHHHKRRYRRGQLHTQLKKAGFIVERVTYVNLVLLLPLLLIAKVGQLLPPNPSRGMNFLGIVPSPINRILGLVMRVEASWLNYANLPIGSSIACVAVRQMETVDLSTHH